MHDTLGYNGLKEKAERRESFKCLLIVACAYDIHFGQSKTKINQRYLCECEGLRTDGEGGSDEGEEIFNLKNK